MGVFSSAIRIMGITHRPERFAECDVLALRAGHGELSLQLGCPMDGAVSVGDHVAGARARCVRILGLPGVPGSTEIRIDVDVEALTRIGLEDQPFIMSPSEVSTEVSHGISMLLLWGGAKTGALVDCDGAVGPRREQIHRFTYHGAKIERVVEIGRVRVSLEQFVWSCRSWLSYQQADKLTKPLSRELLEHHRYALTTVSKIRYRRLRNNDRKMH